MPGTPPLGVTPDDLRLYVSDLTISASTSPSTDEVERMIALEAASLMGKARAWGVAQTGIQPTDDAYPIMRGILIKVACSNLLRARNRGIDAEGMAKEAGIELTRLSRMPQTITSGQVSDSTRVAVRDTSAVPHGSGRIADLLRRGGSL